MKKTAWIKKIKETAVEAGTYKPYFDEIINTLGGILENRDIAEKELKGVQLAADGLHRNPLAVIWNDLNKTALSYWRELGLTPAALKKLDEEKPKEQKSGNSLIQLLEAKRNNG